MKRKKHKQKWVELSTCETYEEEISFRRGAKDLNDQEFLLKIGDYEFKDGPDFTALEVRYHQEPCKKDYLNRWQKSKRLQKETGNAEFNAKKVSKEYIISYIDKYVLKEGKPMYLADGLERYKNIYVANGGSVEKINTYKMQNFSITNARMDYLRY